ncbi:MAG: hypothetical protein AB7S38_11825 [Vulcanimicrobiota bacterium]
MFFRHLSTLVLSLWLLAPALAAPAEVKVVEKGDRIDVVVTTAGKTAGKTREVDSERFLELALPNTSVGKKTIAVDKGLVSQVTTEQNGSTALVRVHFLSKPKASFKSAGNEHIYSVSTVRMASSQARPTAPVAANPRAPVAPVQPVKPVTPTPRPAPAPAPAKPSGKSVSLTLNNVAIREAITAMATQTGLKAEIPDSLTGSTSVSLTDIPLEIALDTVLGGKLGEYRYEITPSTLRILASGGVTVHPTAGGVAYEYYPFRDKSARDMMEAVKLAIPNLTYQVDDRLNILLAQGDPADLDRLTKLLQSMSQK